MNHPSNHRGGRRRITRRAAGLATALACTLGLAGTAQAAGTNLSFSVSVHPAELSWDGTGTPTSASTGSYYANYWVSGAENIPTTVQQLRGGAIVSTDNGFSDSNPERATVSVVPGDVFRIVQRDTGAVFGETAFNGQPVVTASVLGQAAFAGTRSADASGVFVELLRRAARTETSTDYVNGTYQWIEQPKPNEFAPDRDYSEASDRDAIPSAPTADPADGYQWKLKQLTAGYDTTTSRATNGFETISVGRVTGLSGTGFAGAFTTPIAAGDLVSVEQNVDSIANDVAVSVFTRVVAPSGAVPAPDVTAPKVTGFVLGTDALTTSAYLKSGLRAFVTVDKASTVEQQLQVSVKTAPKAKKAKKSTKAKSKKAAKKAKKAKSRAAKAKVKTVVIGSGSGSTSIAGGTAAVTIRPAKGAKKTLAALSGKSVSATLVTTVKDTAGNVTTQTQSVKLTVDNAKKAAKKPAKKKAKKAAKAAKK